MRSDSQDQKNNQALVLRQLGFLNYQSDNKQTEAVFDYIIQEPDLSDSSINQLYIKQYFNNNNQLIAGRFNRFDNLGYYTLDGAQYLHSFEPNKQQGWQQHLSHFSLSSYGGKPLRTDDIHVLTGDYVVGIQSHFRWSLPSLANIDDYEPKLTQMPNDISATFGYQALKIEQASQRINLGLSAKSGQGFFTNKLTGNFRQEFNLSTSLATTRNKWQDSDIEDLTLDARFYLANLAFKQNDFWQLQYQYFKPELSRPTFKQRFYSTYAVGKIALAEMAYHGKLTDDSQYRVAARISNKQRGGKGYGVQAQLSQTLNNDWQLDASFDHLALDSLEISSVYGGIALSPSAVSQLKLQAALQYEQKPLYGDNQLLGLQGSYQYMINANFFVSCSVELLRNSKRANDHLARFYLVYYFDKEQF